MLVGHVAEVWRYPVKSMAGDRLTQSVVTQELGMEGDRAWAVRDDELGEIAEAKRLHGLLNLRASYIDHPVAESSAAVRVAFPDGRTCTSDEPEIDDLLSKELGRSVSLWPRQPSENWQHYLPRSATSREDVREILQLDDEAPLPVPDFSRVPEEMRKSRHFVTPVGTYFNAMPVSLLSTTSLRTLGRTVPGATVDARRFRKNLIVDTPGHTEGYPEKEWIGRTLHVAEVVFEVMMPILRCATVSLPQENLPKDKSVLRSIARHAEMQYGVYLRVMTPGAIAEGDTVEVRE